MRLTRTPEESALMKAQMIGMLRDIADEIESRPEILAIDTIADDEFINTSTHVKHRIVRIEWREPALGGDA